ncbi:protein FAM204A [Trichomycterus rosablanca]|uniref:protein FAM204A n=1 Tax=Trichomycterus rosablanca TaxID=2290929 RepID=UPI002F35AE4B
MYSGLLPPGMSEADLSSDEEEDTSPTTDINPQTDNSPAQSDTHTDKSSTQSDLLNDPSLSDGCLPGVNEDLWQKFKDLQKERENQKTQQPESKKRRKRSRKGRTPEQTGDEEKRQGEEARVKHWDKLTQYFGTNDRFQPPACSRPALKSGLEKSMERAIAEGDYGKAEELSDRLATRELAVKIAQAADCRDFAHTKKEEEDLQAARKRKKQISWGFEAKKRWETKSNMGFM